MLDIEQIEKACVGCGACAQTCKMKCIEMIEDIEGFLRPRISKEICINCGECGEKCPVLTNWDRTSDDVFEKPIAFGGRHISEEVQLCSSSGGVFTLLAEYILEKNGVVVGCSWDENNRAVHSEVMSIDELWRLRKSKYVQSKIGDIYIRVKDHLQAGRHVLFVGTPCQAAGLYSFLGRKYDKLFAVDFICHGVPSPSFLEQYIEYLTSKHGCVKDLEFRVKDKGWNQSGLQLGTRIVYADGNVQRNFPAFNDPYMNGFLGDICLRPSCYDCSFKKIPKIYADYTIADFWGVDGVDKKLNNGQGTSLVLIHNKKAFLHWKEIEKSFIGHEVDFETSVRKNPTLYKSANTRIERQCFFKDLNSKGFAGVKDKYLSVWCWLINKIKSKFTQSFD